MNILNHDNFPFYGFLLCWKCTYFRSFSTAGKDYKKQKTELTFESDTQQLCSEIEIIADDIQEEDESFMVMLCTLQTHTVSLDPQIASVVIIDDDSKLVMQTLIRWGEGRVELLSQLLQLPPPKNVKDYPAKI